CAAAMLLRVRLPPSARGPERVLHVDVLDCAPPCSSSARSRRVC
ncbi:MAG: hypothetical protein AVDCRST_MAG06-3176, partial [uncultured Nocardioides sp.]